MGFLYNSVIILYFIGETWAPGSDFVNCFSLTLSGRLELAWG